jgi:hypothetical protein
MAKRACALACVAGGIVVRRSQDENSFTEFKFFKEIEKEDINAIYS